MKTRLGEESRPRQLARLRLLTAGVVVTISGMLPGWPWLVVPARWPSPRRCSGTPPRSAAQIRRARATLRVHGPGVRRRGLVCFPLGALLGAVMAFSPGEPWQGRLMLAHQIVNVLGFVGLTVTGTPLTLWPTVLRTRIEPRRGDPGPRAGCCSNVLAVLGAVAGALDRLHPAGLRGAARLSRLLRLGRGDARAGRGARRRVRQELPGAARPVPDPVDRRGTGWPALTTAGLLVMWWRSADAQDGEPPRRRRRNSSPSPSSPASLLQVLLGAMSHLLPVTSAAVLARRRRRWR